MGHHFFKGTRVRVRPENAHIFPGKNAGVCLNLRPDKNRCVKVQWDAPEGGIAIVHVDFLEVIV